MRLGGIGLSFTAIHIRRWPRRVTLGSPRSGGFVDGSGVQATRAACGRWFRRSRRPRAISRSRGGQAELEPTSPARGAQFERLGRRPLPVLLI